MGTRNLTAVMLDGEYKIAQYGQWDGYPSGQGVVALAFVSNVEKREKLKRQLEHVHFLTQEEIDKVFADLGLGEWITEEQAEKLHERLPFLNRDIGAVILTMVANCEDRPINLRNSIDFAKDGLFCEWAYVIDFDKNTFEVYKGFNQDPLPPHERFYGPKDENGYYPVHCIKIYRLNELPTQKQFLEEMEELTKEPA